MTVNNGSLERTHILAVLSIDGTNRTRTVWKEVEWILFFGAFLSCHSKSPTILVAAATTTFVHIHFNHLSRQHRNQTNNNTIYSYYNNIPLSAKMVKYIENMDMFKSDVLEASKSKLVVVDFTASWCVSCLCRPFVCVCVCVCVVRVFGSKKDIINLKDGGGLMDETARSPHSD